MKARELKDLRANNPQDLVAKLGELKAELFNLRFQLATGQLESYENKRSKKIYSPNQNHH
jgi:large subunit ribosomal protein L29